MGTAKENFNDSMQFTQATVQTLTSIFEAFAEYLKNNSRFAAEREMAKHWKENRAYPVRGKCMEDLCQELSRNGIPYLRTMDSSMLIVKETDLDRVAEINREILSVKCNYFQSVDSEQLENAIAKSPKVQDKDILTLHGLDKYQCETIKNKCNNITKGFTVGIKEESDGRYAVSIHAPWTVSKNLSKNDFCRAYAEMAFSLYGLNAELKQKQIDADEKLDEEVASLKGCETTHYVVGVDDPFKYIELNSNGFEFHRIRLVNGELQNSEVTAVDKNDPDYEVELQKCMDGIMNKTIVSNEEKLHAHLSVKKRNIETNRPEKNEKQMQISEMESSVIKKADEMIKTGPVAEKLFNSSPEKAFETYQNEMKTILTRISKDDIIPGYNEKDIKEIKDIFKNAEVEPSDYVVAVSALQKYQMETHKAKEKTIEKKKAPNMQDKGGNERER